MQQLDDGLGPPVSEKLRKELEAMQAKNQRNGAVVLGTICAIIIWLFSVPPDIRRTPICGISTVESCTEFSILAQRVATHYNTCGAAGEPPCVNFDFSIDPRVLERNAAVLDSVTSALAPEDP